MKKTKFYKKSDVSIPRVVARKAIALIDPFFGRAISRHLARRGENKSAKEVSPQEMISLQAEIAQLAELPIATDKSIKRVEIIVLKFKDPEVETVCASRVIAHTNWPHKLNFFDNRPGTKNMSKIWNRLIKESTCDYLAIMDSDVFVPKLDPCWLTRLMNTFDEIDNCYVVSPKVTKTSGTQQRAQSMYDGKPERLVTEFAGMCVLYKKEIFEKIGYFDEEFLLYGSDSEWARRLVASDYHAYVRPDVLVEHVAHYSTSKAAKNDPNAARWSGAEKLFAQDLLKKKEIIKKN